MAFDDVVKRLSEVVTCNLSTFIKTNRRYLTAHSRAGDTHGTLIVEAGRDAVYLMTKLVDKPDLIFYAAPIEQLGGSDVGYIVTGFDGRRCLSRVVSTARGNFITDTPQAIHDALFHIFLSGQLMR